MSNFPKQPSKSDVRQAVGNIVDQLVDSTTSIVLTVVGAIGIVAGVILLLDGVSVIVGGVDVSCGSTFLPIDDFSGDRASCGSALADQGVHVAAFLIAGLGFLVFRFVRPGLCRGLVLIGVAAAAACLTGLGNGVDTTRAVIPAFYALGMAVVAGSKGFTRRER